MSGSLVAGAIRRGLEDARRSSSSTVRLCHRHGPVWLARCAECRDARLESLALTSVQSCTVHAADQRERGAGGDS